jgi:glycosyltransferase involved in cell wall biosynthesis
MVSLRNTIVVDLTPVRPAGENGGSKIFVLELLCHLGRVAPQADFVLLTHASSHEELSMLDKVNMRRFLVAGGSSPYSIRQVIAGLFSRTKTIVPDKYRVGTRRFVSQVKSALRYPRSGSLLRNLHADLLFCPFTDPTYHSNGIPTVCTIYDLQHKTYPEFFSAEELARRDQAFDDACLKAVALIAISDYARNSVIAHGKLDPRRVRTIYLRLAQRSGFEAKGDRTVLNRLGLEPLRYLVYPANFWKHKNHEMLLAAFDLACRQGLAADIKLVCPGTPGDRQASLIGTAHSMGLEQRVLFPGYLSGSDLAVLVAECSAVVFPSLYEGFGLPVVEAMALGVPVACSNTTSLPEVAADAAMYFDPWNPREIAQAIRSVVDDEVQRGRLILSGRRRAEEFLNPERMAREYWDSFSDILSKGTRGN